MGFLLLSAAVGARLLLRVMCVLCSEKVSLGVELLGCLVVVIKVYIDYLLSEYVIVNHYVVVVVW